MNRYRTTPGLGPQKAAATTTCQKCLKKGHYSYECKAGVQSRPYVSRPSRSQQLKNPKLKPALVEQKMKDPVAETAEPNLAQIAEVRDTASAEDRGGTESIDAERPAKRRRRSASSSSSSSVATISTISSKSDHGGRQNRAKSRSTSPDSGRRRMPSKSRNRSPRLSSGKSTQKPNDDFDSRPQRNSRSKDRELKRAESPRPARNVRERYRRHDRHADFTDSRTVDRRRRSRTPDDKQSAPPRRREQKPPPRERSLSPYSRRIALTQAMNASR